ncbi:peritrophin-48-like [Drosophila innubila]|uniref:peritrophin-48-like n=1 Tax=Drosophila innubila TaxID=198719 RepID=UPI00148E17F1|nr:peritrophin-48-like [Drosophila innubila]
MYLSLLKKYQNVLLLCLLCWQFTEALTSDCCNEGETKEDSNDCTSYFVCCNGAFVSKTCESGNYWNSNSGSCAPNNGQCCPSTGTCIDNELEVDPQNCAAYYQCVKGQFVSQKCASGSYFDTIIKACVIDTECICTS